MHHRWGLAGFTCLLLSGAATQAHSQSTFLYLNSQPGDYIGAGQQWLVQPSQGTFLAFRNFANGVNISFSGTNPGNFWHLNFAAPFSVDLVPGMYDGATRFPFQSPSAPGLDVSGQGRGCNTLTGRFTVLEVVYGVGGEVQSFAADFEQHCEGGPAALFGSMRFNSSVSLGARLSVSNVFATEYDAGVSQAMFRVSLSAPLEGPVTVDYETVDETATGGSDYVVASGTLTIPAGSTVVSVPVGITGDTLDESDETFRVDLSNPVNAAIAFGSGRATILDDDPDKSLIYFDSDPGDYIGQGVIRRFTLGDGTFTATIQGSSGVRIGFNGPEWWYLTFASPGGAPPTPGVYEGATRWPFQAPGVPGLDVSGDGRGCNELSGRFVVLEAVYGPGPTVERFAADFEQHCEGLPPALLGSVRYHSLVPAAAVSVRSITVPESSASATVRVTLSWPAATPVTVAFSTTNGTASPGSDYVPASGVVTFPPGFTENDIAIPLVDDGEEELDETFRVDLGAVTGASVLRRQALVTIADDDPRYPIELSHGSSLVGNLRFPKLDGDFYVVAQPLFTSWEAVVDATSGDIGSGSGPRLKLVTPQGFPIEESTPVGAGPSRSLRFANFDSPLVTSERIQVQSDSCTITCNADDIYRIRLYETTYRIARFNLAGEGRQAILLVHNPGDEFVSATIVFWSPTGSVLSMSFVTIEPRSSRVLNLGDNPNLAGQSGSITIPNDAPYGGLVGKLVSLESQTGFTFDTPMQPRPH